jgi:hypothetical protein
MFWFGLVRFLIERCSQSIELANYFNWYLAVEKFDKVRGPMFTSLHEHFLAALRRTTRGKEWEKILIAQGVLVNNLVALSENAKSVKGKVQLKAERLKTLLNAEKGEYKHLKDFEPTQYVLLLFPHCVWC